MLRRKGEIRIVTTVMVDQRPRTSHGATAPTPPSLGVGSVTVLLALAKFVLAHQAVGASDAAELTTALGSKLEFGDDDTVSLATLLS
jgi:hypothetical protein